MTDETIEVRIRRLRMRSWRRGIKEMDLILGRFADTRLSDLTGPEIEVYDALLSENDHDLYAWVAGREAAPAPYAGIIARIARDAGA
jgi:antitoxin CptB